MTRKEVLEKQRDEIMDWFDFRKVWRMMRAVDWRYGFEGEVKSERELRSSAREKMNEVIKTGVGCSSGGFEVTIDDGQIHGEHWCRLNFKFVGEHWPLDGETYKGEK